MSDPSPESNPLPESHSRPEPEVRTGSERFNLNAARPTGRPIYESTLRPPRKHRRFSPWLVVPGLLIALGAVLYFLLFAPKPRRPVATAGTVVYASEAGSPGITHLWSARMDGTQAHALTAGKFSDGSPTFTADGNQIAFVSNRAEGASQIFVMDGDGKNPVQYTHNPGAKAQPEFAPGSNSLLGYLAGGNLVVGDVTRDESSPLLPAGSTKTHSSASDTSLQPEAATIVTDFSWKAPSGGSEPGLAAVQETAGVQSLVVVPKLGEAAILTQNGQPDGPPLAAADSVTPAWSPDGSHMAVALLHVQGLPRGQKASGLLLFDAQGAPQRPLFPLLQGPLAGPENPVFSPDGSQIVFELWQQPDLASRKRLGLFVVPADGSGLLRPLVKGDAGSAQFSPDGTYLYFIARSGSGRHDLYRIRLDGTGAARISDGKSEVTGFALSPQTQKG